MSRDPETIQREIEENRAALAGTLDEIAERANPRRVVAAGRQRALAAARSPAGRSVLGAVAGLTALFVVARIRRARRG